MTDVLVLRGRTTFAEAIEQISDFATEKGPGSCTIVLHGNHLRRLWRRLILWIWDQPGVCHLDNEPLANGHVISFSWATGQPTRAGMRQGDGGIWLWAEAV
jgi:hypothetical protein